jgi:hypothetical protein
MLRITLAAATLFVAGTAFAQVTCEGDRVEVKGMEMYYEVSGTGEPMIVRHGSFMTTGRRREL